VSHPGARRGRGQALRRPGGSPRPSEPDTPGVLAGRGPARQGCLCSRPHYHVRCVWAKESRPCPLAGHRPGQPSALLLRVGALFEHDAGGDHFCRASVVASPGRDLLITAAHCINGGKGGGYRQDVVFIPGYRDGQARSGIWTPARLVVAPQWVNSSDPDFDVGFVVLKPDDGKNIEDVLGADQFGIDPDTATRSGSPATRPAPMPRSPAPAGRRSTARPSCGSSATGSPAALAAARGWRASTRRPEPAPSWE
jgi:hypothetical protein